MEACFPDVLCASCCICLLSGKSHADMVALPGLLGFFLNNCLDIFLKKDGNSFLSLRDKY
jgi:hypothetical protein